MSVTWQSCDGIHSSSPRARPWCIWSATVISAERPTPESHDCLLPWCPKLVPTNWCSELVRRRNRRGKLSKDEAVFKSDDGNQPERPSRIAEMSPPGGPSRFQLLGVTILIIAYALLSQYSSEAPARGLGAVLSLMPIVLIVAIVVWRWRRSLIGALVAIS